MAGHKQQGFEGHWDAHAGAGISSAKETEARSFLQPALEQMHRATGPMRILDVGCGDGVHAVALAREGLSPHRYHGVDLSARAVILAKTRVRAVTEDPARFFAGSALALPFRSSTFDVIFSYGVIGYTGSPGDVMDEMVRVCRPGGLLGVWVYPRIGGVAGWMFSCGRALCRRLGGQLSRGIVYAVVPLLGVLPVRSGTNLRNSTWRQCVELVEVNLLPRVLDYYSWEEVVGWFRARCLDIVCVNRTRPIEVWARVPE